MDIEKLTPEQREKVLACKSPKDILALAKEEGCELSEAELESLSGGEAWHKGKNYDFDFR